MIAYKLFRIKKDGTITSLFINKSEKLEVGKWIRAKSYPTKGFKVRAGWHSTPKPIAPHLSMKGRKWFKVVIKNVRQEKRPENQGGLWFVSGWLKIIGEK